MDYICGTCGESLPRDLLVVIPHTEEHIVEEIKKTHPKWAEHDGVCKKCYEYYKKQMGK
jgi:hypothetical protein